ncbi:DUF1810 domain-containing protein [Pandoraea sp.]|uniref:DUF1810 domain-containing protein n=1 Tax=Pandoraea sp. TaxID=1883445 RepID=UPI00120BA077|nr:DUF1810 domain-containing protein [Pandoraea sp.]TAL53168.1 MAG: DUF1810 domain-containing protein [Pandoraea sp.]TAM20624.1 MAG: DUF1810 domain-containing protein [Pandoraea sp.]
MEDPYDLQRFVEAQDPVYARVCDELRAGRKRSHWMWFVFPQMQGLGQSPMAQRYAIGSLAEAHAYLEHPVLGERLRACTQLVNSIEGRPVTQIFGAPDDLKFHSSMTLFSCAAADGEPFRTALRKYFDGAPDTQTLARLPQATRLP